MQDEIRLRCLGTATPASKLVPMAVQAVGRLRDVDEFGFKQIRGENWWIEIKLNGGYSLITIWEDGSVDAAACPSYLSGMTQFGFNAYRYNNNTGARIDGMYAFAPSMIYASRNKIPSGWGVVPFMLAASTANSGAPSVAPTVLGVQPPPWVATEWTQAAYLKPGLFSGQMRQVVQVLLGSKAPVLYNYRFTKTHGVLRQSLDNGKFKDYLVEISQENGVLIMPMPGCTASVPTENTLGYVPTGDSFPTGDKLADGLRSGSVKRLLEPGDLAEVYAKQPFSDMFGWAFTYAGSKASAVVSAWSGGYLNTYLYTINITPESASLVFEEGDKIVWQGVDGDGYATALFKVPHAPGDACHPVDFGASSGAAALVACNAPLHVFYRRDGNRVLVRYRNGPVVLTRPTDEHRRPRPSGAEEYADIGDEAWAGILSLTGQDFVEYGNPSTINSNYWERINQQIYIEGRAPDVDRHTPTRNTYLSLASSGNVGKLSQYGSSHPPPQTISMMRLIRTYTSSQSEFTQTINTSVVASSFDREVVATSVVTSSFYGVKNDTINTYNGTEAVGFYFCNESLPGAKYRDADGMFIGGIYILDQGSSHSPDGTVNISGAIMGSGWGDSYNSGGTAYKDSFGGFSAGGPGDGFANAYLSPADGFSLLGEADTMLAPLQPLYSSSPKNNVYSRRVKKVSIYGATDVPMPNLVGSGADEFTDQPLNYKPDFSWFGFASAAFPGNGSWDFSLRFSPPQLNNYEYTHSQFGGYPDPESAHPLLINFVGDT